VDVGFLRTPDLDDKRISSINSWVSFMIDSMDGELSGFVVKDLSVSDTFTSGIRSSSST